MNLRKILVNLILEFKGKTFYLSDIIKDDKIIEIGFSYEQNELRAGKINPLDSGNTYILNQIIRGTWRSGIYNVWIRDVVEKNFNKVFSSVIKNKENEVNRLIFIGSNEYFDGMEFVVDFEIYSKTHIGIKVITSGPSLEKRNFFFNKEDNPVIKLLKENKKIIQIYLFD